MNLSSSNSKFPYLYRGIVKDNQDPLNIGRCKIHIPDIYGVYNYDKELLPWSRPITGASIKIPDLEEIVWVMFEDGNKQSPVYIVGVLTTKNPLEDTDIDFIYQYGDCKIYYNKKTGELYITVGDSTIYIKTDQIDLRTANLLINGKPAGSGGGLGGGIWKYIVVKDVGEEFLSSEDDDQ